MKKKNWLLTIAFAVLSLTIISTCVIGSTYAKFTTTIGNGSTAQAAGFLVTGSSTNTEATVLLAPGEDVTVAAGISSYFSQVETQIVLTNVVNSANNTGVFTDDNWALLVAYFNDHVASDNDHKVSGTGTAGALRVLDLIVFDESATSAETIAQAIYTAGYSETPANNVWSDTYTTDSDTLPAMKATAQAAVTLSTPISVHVTWTSRKVGNTNVDNDEFDTFVGNCIAKLAMAESSGSVVVATDGATPTPNTLTLTAAAAHQTSTVAASITITAQQVVA